MKPTRVLSSHPSRPDSPPPLYGSTAFPQRPRQHSFLSSTYSAVHSSKASQRSHGTYGHGVSSKIRRDSDHSIKKRKRGSTLTRANWSVILGITHVALD